MKKNTKVYHILASFRRKENFIDRLKNIHGDWTFNRVEIGESLKYYFNDIYSLEEVTFKIIDLKHFSPGISNQDNNILCKIPTCEEIFLVVINFGALKAPGPDGYQATCYQNFWDIVGNDVCIVVQNVFRASHI